MTRAPVTMPLFGAAGENDTPEQVAASLRDPKGRGVLRGRIHLLLTIEPDTVDGLVVRLDERWPESAPHYGPSVDRRRKELVTMERIEDSGQRRPTRRGSPAIVWRVVGPSYDTDRRLGGGR